MRNIYKILLLSISMILLIGCGRLHPYYVDVQQGNDITDIGAVAKLHVGLNKSEVSSIIGAPLLSDIFSPDTWTYVYTNQINGGKIEKRKLILEFQKNKLVRITQ